MEIGIYQHFPIECFLHIKVMQRNRLAGKIECVGNSGGLKKTFPVL